MSVALLMLTCALPDDVPNAIAVAAKIPTTASVAVAMMAGRRRRVRDMAGSSFLGLLHRAPAQLPGMSRAASPLIQ